jgi:hypothetical protein
MSVTYETCPTSAPFFGFMGVTAALCFASKYFLWDRIVCAEASLNIVYYNLAVIDF